MTSWFQRIAPKLIPSEARTSQVPKGVWIKCPSCSETLYSKNLEKRLKTCPACNHHFRLTSEERIDSIFDENTFQETHNQILAKDPLKFFDSKKYKDRLKATMTKTQLNEAITTGIGKINGLEISIAVFNFRFMGGSMGSVVGEKITRAIEDALEKRIPMLIVSASGGARMQEGVLSLMQMAKTSAALKKLSDARLPFISLLTDPTTGGVSASFAMLGDVNLVEPGALVGFAGPRVIKETIRQDLPDGFQRAEFLMEHGAVDMIVDRSEMKDTLYRLFNFMTQRVS